MGIGSSKGRPTKDDSPVTSRKQIGKRSSVNFLQRLESKAEQSRRPASSLPIAQAELQQYLSKPLPQPLSSHPPTLSPSSSTTVTAPAVRTLTAFQERIPDSSASSALSLESAESSDAVEKPPQTAHARKLEPVEEVTSIPDSPCSSQSSANTPVTEQLDTNDDQIDAPIATPPLISDDEPPEDGDLSDTEDSSDPTTPLASLLPPSDAPLLRVPTPLVQDSPTRYGLEEAMESARVAASRDVQKKHVKTGPELFYYALGLAKSVDYHNLAPVSPVPTRQRPVAEYPSRLHRVYRPRNKYSPAEVFRRTLNRPHMLPPPRGADPSPRLIRLLRRPYPFNLLRDESADSGPIRFAIAQPLTLAQRRCHGQHGRWHEIVSLWQPAECAVCLCAAKCPGDTKATYMCDYCALRVCGACKSAWELHPADGLVRRERDGGRTVEARRWRAQDSRKSAMQ